MATKTEINEQFENALALMEEGNRCLFITGKAGTGKSTLLSYFCSHTANKPVVLAPTGVAALNVKGQTIHSFFNFYVDVTPQKVRDGKAKPRNPKLYKKLKTIVIDEVSMMRADILDCIDVFLRMYGPATMQPFGGVQMIFIGDLYQLPPIVSQEEKALFGTHYKTPYFFSAHVLEYTPFEVIELDTVYRQKDPVFVTLLNKIRNNSVGDADIKRLNSRHVPLNDAAGAAITLTTTNQRADEINAMRLDALKGKIHRAKASITGSFTKDYFPTAPDLSYKIGAQIMMLNNDSGKRWVNGSLGVIEGVKKNLEGEEYLLVRLRDGIGTVDVAPYKWEVFSFGVEGDSIVSEPAGTFTQYPFRLAWAITIHKSQGKTFDAVVIDIGRGAFAAGQVYVALSRCTSFEGITLATAIGKPSIRTDARIIEFMGLRPLTGPNPDIDKAGLIQNAIKEQSLLDIVYLKGDDTQSSRTVRPLTLGAETYQGKAFTGMKAFCLLRKAECMFSLDRIPRNPEICSLTTASDEHCFRATMCDSYNTLCGKPCFFA